MSATDRALVKHPQVRKAVVKEVLDERLRQDTKWGEQNHRDGTGPAEHMILDIDYRPARGNDHLADCAKARVDALARVGRLTYAHIFFEEAGEALAAEANSPELREELIQTAAVCVAWVEAMDRRSAYVPRAIANA